MNDQPLAISVVDELENQNPAVAHAFRVFLTRMPPMEEREFRKRRHAALDIDLRFPMASGGALPRARAPSLKRREGARSAIWVLLLFTVSLVGLGIVIGPSILRFLQQNWKAVVVPACSICIGAGIVLLVSRIGKAPLSKVAPPKEGAENPLQELEALAERTASRLRAAYALQLWTAVALGVLFLALITWSMMMVFQKRLLYASAFGSGSVAMIILTQWKWQPFDRINQARRLADNADILATGLRLRIKTIEGIADPSDRSRAQWEAVREYLDRS